MKNYKRNLVSFFFVALFTTILFTACPPQKTPSTGDPKSLTLITGSSDGATIYYYLDGAWYSDRACTKKVALEIEAPNALNSTIKVNFGGGVVDNSSVSLSLEDEEDEEDMSVRERAIIEQKTVDLEVLKENKQLSWDFKFFHKDGSAENYFGDGNELKLPANGITENVTLVAEYDNTRYKYSLPNLVKTGLTFKGYVDNTNNDVKAEKALYITNTQGNRIYTASFVNDSVRTLTLNIEGQDKPQKLYYGVKEQAWYSEYDGKGGALQEQYKIKESVKPQFTIPSSPTWTVTLDKGTPNGANASDFSFSENGSNVSSISVKAELSLISSNNTSVDYLIDKATGVIKAAIDNDTTINGTYPAVAIGKTVIAKSENKNYEFNEWESGDQKSSDLATIKVKGATTVKASWKNIATFKLLRVMDNGVEIDKAYFNSKDEKWYESESTTTPKTSVKAPNIKEKTYTVEYNYDNGSSLKTTQVKSAFLGYGLEGESGTKLSYANNSISLSGYEINDHATLESKWAEVKADKPSNVNKDGYKLVEWTKNGKEYDFNTPLDENIKLKAEWAPKEYNTLTLNITGKEPKYLYYGTDDNTWYKALNNNNLLLNENKVEGEVTFNVPETETWTVTFDKNAPNGANADDFALTPSSVNVVSQLVLIRDDLIETNGKVKVDSIVNSETITGEYKPTPIGTTITTISNGNYKFKNFVAPDDETIAEDISGYKVSGNTTIKATWENISDLKVLTVKDGNDVIDTAYYNTNGNVGWYNTNDPNGLIDKNKKTTVVIPNSGKKTYAITLVYDNGRQNDNDTRTSSFQNYKAEDKTIGADGNLNSLVIDSDTTLYATWSEVKYPRPAGNDPTKDGYTFDKWSLDGTDEFVFDSTVITSDVTIKALWTKKTYKTLTLNVEGNEQHFYYGSDGAWYDKLENDLLLDRNKKIGDDRKFTIPSKNDWTVSLVPNAPEGATGNFSLGKYTITVSPKLSLSDESIIDKDTGVIKVSSILSDVVITGSYPKQKISENVTATSSNKNYAFNVWQLDNGTTVSGDNLANVEVNGSTTIKATWKNIAEFYTLIVTDGGEVQDRAYYNTADKQWYESASISSALKSSVKTPRDSVRNYAITLDLAGGKTADGKTEKVNYANLQSSFLGYGEEGKIGDNGELKNDFSIDKNTTLASRRAIVKIDRPAEPERDGFTFGGWTINGVAYDFDNPVTSDTTLTASWNRIGYSELTLNIPAKGYSKTLYYGTNGSWYKALGKDNLLLSENKINEKAKFDIPTSPVWTAKFDKNAPIGAEDSQITITTSSIQKTPTLTLTPSDVISTSEETYGEVISAISGNTTITGTYPAVAIGENATATSDNSNFEFKEWVVTKADGTTEVIGEDEISSYTINGDVTIKATWENKSDIKTLRVYGDNDELLDKAYFNTRDGKWYSTNDVNALNDRTRITSVKLPSNLTKSHAVYLNYNRGLDEEPYNIVNLPRTFKGYATSQTENEVKIPTTGLLDGYTITDDADLYAIWSDARYVGANKDPERDGYVLENWVLDSDETETPFDFDNNKVTSDITLKAIWTKKTYKTLTLIIPGGTEQKLYYGSDSSWYKALGDDNLLLSANRISDIRNERLTIPASPKWTATIHVNAPGDALDKTKFYVSKTSITKTPTLSLSDESVIDKSTGRVRVTTISRDISVTGSYNGVRLAESATARSTDGNYVFKGWATTQALGEGENTINLLDYEIRDNVDIYAIWDNKSDFKLLTVMNGDETIDTAYYNTADKLWYSSPAVESGNRKTNVLLPEVKTKNYVVTLDYNNGSELAPKTLTSSFNGYGTRGEIRADGSLSSYSISVQATLNSSWTEVKASKPAVDPRYDGHTFDKWVLEGDESNEYDFNKAVTGNITIKALWKTNADYKTLTLRIGSDEQKLYYGADGIWYKALGEGDLLLAANRVYSTNVKFNISSSSVSMEFENETPNGAKDEEFKLSTKRISKTSTLNITQNATYIDKTTGVVKISSISENTVIIGNYSEIKVGENVTATTENKNWEFDKWVKVNSDGTTTPIEGSIAEYVVTESKTTFRATWKSKAAFTPLTLKNKAGSIVNKIYYNSTDDKWYSTDDITTATEMSIAPLPEKKSVEYDVTFKDGDKVYLTSQTTPSSFTGYYLTEAINPSINATGTLYNYRISAETELTERWSAAKAERPQPPTDATKVFDKWTDEKGADYDFDSEVTENITLFAKWSEAVTITFKDGTETKDTAYYNPKTEKWTTTLTGTDEKTSVTLPASQTKEHHVTFSLDGGTLSGDTKVPLTSNFEGYANEGGTVVIGKDGLIPSTFKPAESLTLVSSWSEVKASKPAGDPTKDGYNFEKWYLLTDAAKAEYDFTKVVTEDITLVAAWEQKECYTLTIDGKAYYYEQGSTNEWYSALGEGGLLLEKNKMLNKSLTPPRDKSASVQVLYSGGSLTKGESDKNNYFKDNILTEYKWAFKGYGDGTDVFIAANSMTLPASIGKNTDLVAQYDTDHQWSSNWWLPLLTKNGYILTGYKMETLKEGDTSVKIGDPIPFEQLPYELEVSPDTTYIFTAQWTKKDAKTLTLSIPGSTDESKKTQTLYYGSDGAWYKAISEDDLLLDANKILIDAAVKFDIPTAPTWTVTVEKNRPEGATDDQITVPTIAAKKPTLSLDNTIVDASTGKITGTITENTTVNGTYDSVAIGTIVAPSSTNPNYTFKNWKVKKEGETTEVDKTNDELASYEISGNVTLTAEWNFVPAFIPVTFTNGSDKDFEKATLYYNKKDSKWYKSNTSLKDVTSKLEKTPSKVPSDYYEVVLNDEDGSYIDSGTTADGTFNGFKGKGQFVANEFGELQELKLSSSVTEFDATAEWTKVKVSKPVDPDKREEDPITKEGYNFTGWKLQGEEGAFDFASRTIDGNITLVAMWEEIKVYSLKIWKSNADLVSGTVDPTLSYYWNPEKEKWFTDVACTSEVADGFEVPNNLSKGVIVNLDLQGGSIDSSSSWKNGENIWSDFNGYYQPATYSFFYQKNDKRILPSNGIANDVKLYAASTSMVSCNLLSSKFTKSGSSILGFKREGQTNVENSITFVYEYPRQEYNVTAIWGHTLTVNYNADDTATYYYGSDDNWYQDVKDSSGAVTGKAVISEADLTNALSSRDITVTLDYDGGEVDEGNTSSYCKFSDSVKTNTFSVDIKYWQTIYSLITCDKVLSYAKSDDLTITPDGGEVRFITPTLTKSNYTFAGWKDEQGDTTVLDSFGNISAKIADGTTQTFTAVWEEVTEHEYTVTLETFSTDGYNLDTGIFSPESASGNNKYKPNTEIIINVIWYNGWMRTGIKAVTGESGTIYSWEKIKTSDVPGATNDYVYYKVIMPKEPITITFYGSRELQ